MTCSDFPTAATISNGFSTLSSEKENSALPESLLHSAVLSSAAWLPGLRQMGTTVIPRHANAPVTPECCSPSAPRRTHRWTRRCTQGQASFSQAFLRYPGHCRNALNSRVGLQQAAARPVWLSLFISSHSILSPPRVPRQMLI